MKFSSLMACLICLACGFSVSLVHAQKDQPQRGPAEQPPAPSIAAEEGMIAYAQGTMLLKTGKIDEAIEALRKAVKYQPLQAQYRYQLAQAYARAGKFINRWFQLRQAVRLDPNLKAAVDEFWELWRYADERGVLDVGTPQQRVRESLGEPDHIESQDERAYWQYGLMAIDFEDDRLHALVDLRDTGGFKAAQEELEIGLDAGTWKLRKRLFGQNESVLEYIGETDGYEQQFSIYRMVDMRQKSGPREIMQRLEQSLRQVLPNVHWRVLDEKPGDVLFEWWNDAEQPPQHEITRMIAGAEDVHRLVYSAKTGSLPEDQRAHWLEVLRNARLVGVP